MSVKSFSLRARLTWLLALMIFLVLGSAARIVDLRSDSDMNQRFDSALLARAQALATLVHSGSDRLEVDPRVMSAGVFPGTSGRSWYVMRCNGKLVARTRQVPPPMPLRSTPVFGKAKLADGTRLRMVAFRFQPPGSVAAAPACTLRYALDREPLRAILRALDYILLGTLLGGCALVLLLTPWLVRRTLRPLSVLDRAMADIGPDTPGKRLPVTGVTELAPVVDRFNQVLSRMDAGLAREHQFASGLAHEFRTRLAELRTLVDVETRYPSGRDSRSLLGEVGAIGGELEATVTALLQLTRIESGLEQAQREDISVAKFVTRACNRQRQTAERRGVPLVMDLAATADATVAADPALLEIVLDNLLGNAVAYAPAGTPVTVRADTGQVEIVNAARALRAEDLGNLGRRFWRKGAQGAGHAGLGLALAGAAARALHMPLNFRLQDGALHAVLQWSAEAGA